MLPHIRTRPSRLFACLPAPPRPAQALALNLYIDSAPADGAAGPLSLGRFLNDHPDPARINVRFEKARRAGGGGPHHTITQ